MNKNKDFSKLELYLENKMTYKKVKVISFKEIHTEYFDVYFHIFDGTNVYSEFVDSEDYKQWLTKSRRIENINKILNKV